MIYKNGIADDNDDPKPILLTLFSDNSNNNYK